MPKKWNVTFIWHGNMEVETDEATTNINEAIREYVSSELSQLSDYDGKLEWEVEESNV